MGDDRGFLGFGLAGSGIEKNFFPNCIELEIIGNKEIF